MSKLNSLQWSIATNFIILIQFGSLIAADPKPTSYENSVCFTSEDCQRGLISLPDITTHDLTNEISKVHNEDKSEPQKLPMFCHNKKECLCNRLQFHSHSSYEMVDLMQKCSKCTLDVTDLMDPCAYQDSRTFCNKTNGLCECSSTSISGSDQTARSICLNRHLTPSDSITDSAPDEPVHPHMFDWILTVCLGYILPFLIIFGFVYVTFKHFCATKETQDSEMILYRQL